MTDQSLPKLFYAFTLIESPKYKDVDNELDLSELSQNVYKDFETFLFIHSVEDTQMTMLLYTDISVVNELKLFFLKSVSPMDIEVKVVNDFLLNGEFLTHEFWKELIQELDNDWIINEKQALFFHNFIKENTTVEDIIDKMSNLGKENLLQVELDILESLQS